jgi:hypothetical protein
MRMDTKANDTGDGAKSVLRTRSSWLLSGYEGAPEEPQKGPRGAHFRTYVLTF